MAYSCQLPNGPELFLENSGDQTIVRLLLQQSGQQQQSSSSFLTGAWKAAPQIQLTAGGAIVQIFGAIGESAIQIQGMSTQFTSSNIAAVSQTSSSQTSATSSIDTHPLELKPIGETRPADFVMKPLPPIQPMQPMQPLQPLQMGNMQMGMNPMNMQMGNMQMSMGKATTVTAASTNGSSGHAKFCSQCGSPVQPIDRFCASCGHTLQA